MKVNYQANYPYTNTYKPKFKKEFSAADNFKDTKNYSLMSYPANYYVSFGSSVRVDKGLSRFYDKNKDLMPETMRKYVDDLSEEEKSGLTPLSAQQNAFEYLSICDSVDDIKDIYPDEPLFADLKSCYDTKTRQGFLNDVGVIYDNIKEEGSSILSSGEDLTLYTVKKIFLEGKTIGEINEDLDSDIHEVLKREDKNYISPYTCKVLGIKLPQRDYLTSLRYTREGYSDEAGRKITEAWERLPDEEKEKRIAHLSAAQKNMSPEQKEKLRKQRSESMKKHWQEMPNAEKTEYIEKLQTGSQEQSIIMISSWNKCPQVRKDLSTHLREANFHNTEKIIYSDKPYSALMSAAMTEFWEKYPEHAAALGEAIIKTNEEIEDAKENGDYDKYVEEAIKTSKQIKAEIKAQALAETKAKQRKKGQKSAPGLTGNTERDREINLAAIAMLERRTEEPYYPEEFIFEEASIMTEKIINPEYDIQQDMQDLIPKLTAANYAVLSSLYSCTDDDTTKVFLSTANVNDIQEICKQIHGGNINPVINKSGKNKTLHFSKQPDKDLINSTYKSYTTPLTNFELKKIKQMYQDKIKEECLKPQNGYLRELLGIAKDPNISVQTNILLQCGNPKFIKAFLDMCIDPDQFMKNIIDQNNGYNIKRYNT